MEEFNHDKIFEIRNEKDFEDVAIEIFNYQYRHCSIYQQFVDHIKVNPLAVTSIEAIPFLPIEFFRTHVVIDNQYEPEICFTSSGTTGNTQSNHYVAKKTIYEKSFLKTFSIFYGNPSELAILALLPSYLERSGSSLVYMVERLIKESKNEMSGFFLNDTEELLRRLEILEKEKQNVLLLGVSFALLELSNHVNLNLEHTAVMETGGMKGRGKEITRDELHGYFKSGFGIREIHSEYGMTELLSQAYSDGKGIFMCPPWMKILTRDLYDPFSLLKDSNTGGVNVIDLANIHSCSFIETQDIGKVYNDKNFEIMGRIDRTIIRGCNLMY